MGGGRCWLGKLGEGRRHGEDWETRGGLGRAERLGRTGEGRLWGGLTGWGRGDWGGLRLR